MHKEVLFISLVLVASLFLLGCSAPEPATQEQPVQETAEAMRDGFPAEETAPLEETAPAAGNTTPAETAAPKEQAIPEELSFDLSLANANPLDFDRKGPYFHTIMKTTSADGRSFSPEAEAVFEHTSVPDVLRLPDGKIALYAVDGAGRSRSGLLVAFSDDEGNSWKAGSVQLATMAGHVGAADPEVVLLPDGTVRMYYVIFPQPNVHTGNNQIWSALSSDGIHFVEEEGIRFTYERLTDPDVAKIGQKWFIYFSQGPRLVAASSGDGKTFTLEKTIREQGSVSNTVSLGNTQWRQYYCNDGIKSAVSSDGLNWRDESGVRITADAGSMVCDPAPLKVEGGWILFYKVSPGES